MDITQLKNETVGVLGFGSEGKAIVRYLLSHGISPVVYDMKPFNEIELADQEYLRTSGLRIVFGPNALQELTGCTVLFRSPGIWRLHPDLVKAEKNGIFITSQTNWFFEHTVAKIIGVTGTKGKGTTSTLVYEITRAALEKKAFKAGGLSADSRVFLTGNIGKTAPFELLDSLTSSDIVVFELSSFQLQDLTRSPHIGICLMVTQEHLDIHASLAEYVEAKSSITAYQQSTDFSISNIDYSASRQIGMKGNGVKWCVSKQSLPSLGAFIEADAVAVHIPAIDARFDFSERQLRGAHNMENIAAAVLAGYALHIDPVVIEEVVKHFKGLEHRLEFVTIQDGVSFYNDSFATTPETTIAAVRSFQESIILVLGGSEKNSDFSELGTVVADAPNVRAVILIGKTASRIEAELRANAYAGTVYTGADTMTAIFSQISEVAQAGDVVLLSPACASFGMFKNYIDRGVQFKEHARGWRKHG